jgi:hypothetical protein
MAVFVHVNVFLYWKNEIEKTCNMYEAGEKYLQKFR